MKRWVCLSILCLWSLSTYAQEQKVGNIWKYTADFLVEIGVLRETDQLVPIVEPDGHVTVDFYFHEFLSNSAQVLPEYVSYDIPYQEDLLIYSFFRNQVHNIHHLMLVKRGNIGFIQNTKRPEDILKDIYDYSIENELTREEILEVLQRTSIDLRYNYTNRNRNSPDN